MLNNYTENLFKCMKPSMKEIVTDLVNSPIDFYLTGSRFFGTNIPTSDFDFMVADTIDNRVWLSSIGFKMNSASTYKDSITSGVMIFICSDGKVDIQLVTNIAVKLRAQNYLKTIRVFLAALDKASARRLWDEVISNSKIEEV